MLAFLRKTNTLIKGAQIPQDESTKIISLSLSVEQVHGFLLITLQIKVFVVYLLKREPDIPIEKMKH